MIFEVMKVLLLDLCQLLNLVHVYRLHVLLELVNLHHEDDFVEVWQCFYWISVEELWPYLHHKIETTLAHTWWAPSCPCWTSPPVSWLWYCESVKTFQFHLLICCSGGTVKMIFWRYESASNGFALTNRAFVKSNVNYSTMYILTTYLTWSSSIITPPPWKWFFWR